MADSRRFYYLIYRSRIGICSESKSKSKLNSLPIPKNQTMATISESP